MAGAEIIGKEELLEIQELFEKDKTILYRYGPKNYKTTQFENEFADYFGVKYAHAVSSGTAAIHCALDSVGIGPGDEVITTAFTFIAPIEAIAAFTSHHLHIWQRGTFMLPSQLLFLPLRGARAYQQLKALR